MPSTCISAKTSHDLLNTTREISAAMSTTLLEATISSPRDENGGSSYLPSRHAAEVEGATNRFAAAQKLFKFKDHSSITGNPIHSPTRPRTNTSTSLYSKLDSSALSASDQGEEGEATSSFTDAFMRTRPRQIPKPTTAPALASSKDETPPTPVDNGCILLGPRRSLHPLDVTKSITARTDSGSPAWYCRHDTLVIFGGFRTNGDGVSKMVTRSSRGLDVARRNCPKVAVKVEVPCGHCRGLLKLSRNEWVFQERMLECGVCRMCQERCMVEWGKMEEAKAAAEEVPVREQEVTHDSHGTKEVASADQATAGVAVPRVLTQSAAKDGEQQAKRDSVLQHDELPSA